MQWIRSHLSFANSISLIALFVALGGTSLAAVTLTKNSVGAKQIKKNAVGVSEIKKNAVRASEVNRNAVGASETPLQRAWPAATSPTTASAAADLSDNSVGGGELGDNSVGSGEVTDDSLTADGHRRQLRSTLRSAPDFFARVQAERHASAGRAPASPRRSRDSSTQNIVKGEGGLPQAPTASTPREALECAGLAGQRRCAAGDRNLVTSVAIDRGEDLGDCPADTQRRARIRIVDTGGSRTSGRRTPGSSSGSI